SVMLPPSRSAGAESVRSDASNSAPAGYVITDQPSIFAPEIPNGVRRGAPDQKIPRRLGKHSRWVRFEINVQRVSRTHATVELGHLHHPPDFCVKQRLAIEIHYFRLLSARLRHFVNDAISVHGIVRPRIRIAG